MNILKKTVSMVLVSIVMSVCAVVLVRPASAQTTRPLKYYVADRVRNNSDYALLAGWGINTAVVDFKVGPENGESTSVWDARVNAAAAAGIKLVIWPDGHQGSDVSGCRWETPFDDGSVNNGTDYLVNIRSILDRYGNNPNVIGIVTAHEPVWVSNSAQDRCSENIADMTKIKTQIRDYIDNTVHRNPSYEPFKVWNYIDNIYNMSSLEGYSSSNRTAQIQGIMDVAVIWQHCAGYPTYSGDGSACEGSSQYTALGGISYDRNLIRNSGLEGAVEEVFLVQTFHQGTSGDYAGKFTLDELQKYSASFINSNALDGYGYYTWDEGWYTGNLKKYTDLQPAVSYIYTNVVQARSSTSPLPSPSTSPSPLFSPTPSPSTLPSPSVVASPTPIPSTPEIGTFRFASIGDAHLEISNFTQTMNQIRSLNPNIVIFNGDVENEGTVMSQLDPTLNVLGALFNQTFIVRGNHDDHASDSAAVWESYFTSKWGDLRTVPAGMSNYVAINDASTYLTYSFDYGNSRFIALDANADADPPTSTQLSFLDSRLTDAENRGLTHAFIFTHPPEYCVESTHCSCQNTTGCGPSSAYISILNKHPIISATFHGHEHLLGWTHMTSTRVPGLTREYEEFITSPAGNSYGLTPYPNRLDFYRHSSSKRGFGIIDVKGNTFTVSLYQTGTTTPIWSQSFTKPAANPSPSTTPFRGDIDENGVINIYDYNLLISYFGKPYTIYDFNTLITNFGR